MSYPNKIVNKTEKREEILLKVLRKEIGKRQCSEPLSRGYISEESGLEKKHVDYAVKCLVKKHLVSFYDTADGKVFYLGFKNQNFLQKAKRFREKFGDKITNNYANNVISFSKIATFDLRDYLKDKTPKEKEWFNFKISVNHVFDSVQNADYELTSMKNNAKRLGITEEELVTITIHHHLYSFKYVNETHILAWKNKEKSVKKLDKQFFQKENKQETKPTSWKEKEKEALDKRSRKAVDDYLEQLKKENPKKWLRSEAAIRRIAEKTIERGFNYGCAKNFYVAIVKKVFAIVEEKNQDIDQLVDYNIKYNKTWAVIVPVGAYEKPKQKAKDTTLTTTQKTVINNPEPKQTPLPDHEPDNVIGGYFTELEILKSRELPPIVIDFHKEGELELVADLRKKIYDYVGKATYAGFYDKCNITLENNTVKISSDNLMVINYIKKQLLCSHKNGNTVLQLGLEDIVKEIEPELIVKFG